MGLTATDLPSSILSLDVYMGRAKSDVLKRDPLAALYDEDSEEALHVKRAWEYLIAARIAETWRPVKREVFDSGRYQYEAATWDPLVRSALLRGWAEEEFEAYLDPTDTDSDFPAGFLLAHGYRGR